MYYPGVHYPAQGTPPSSTPLSVCPLGANRDDGAARESPAKDLPILYRLIHESGITLPSLVSFLRREAGSGTGREEEESGNDQIAEGRNGL